MEGGGGWHYVVAAGEGRGIRTVAGILGAVLEGGRHRPEGELHVLCAAICKQSGPGSVHSLTGQKVASVTSVVPPGLTIRTSRMHRGRLKLRRGGWLVSFF